MTVRATHDDEFQGIPPTGKRVVVRVIWIDRVLDGRIAQRWGQVDMLGVMRQLGAIPTPETTEA